MPCEADNPYSKVQAKRISCSPGVPAAGDQNHKAVCLFVQVFLHYADTSFQIAHGLVELRVELIGGD